MNGEKKFIGFDLGAESGRCVVGVLREQKIVLQEVHRFTTQNVKCERGMFWDILAIYKEIVEGLKKARRGFGSSFGGIGIDTWGVDYVLVDSDGRILGYPYHYRDSRTDHMMEQAFKIVPKEQIYGMTGIQFAKFNTLFQLLAEKKRRPNLLDVADTMLLMPDFLNFMMSGIKKAEFSIASTTGLADPIARNWSWKLIDAIGLPRTIFPEVVEPGTMLGALLPSIARETGLERNLPIIATTGHDTASAVVSVPASEDNWAFLSSGTWSLMGIELKSPVLTSQAMKYNFTNEGGFGGTTRFLKNIIGLWPVQESRRFWAQKSKQYSYSELASMAFENGYAGSWINLGDETFLKDGEMPETIMAYLLKTGQANKRDIGFIIRVVLESLAFSYRNVISELESISGNGIKRLHVVGGGIQNELLTQLTADAIGRPVIAGPIEGAIIGNIGVQAIAVGAVRDVRQWREIVARSFDLKVYEPINGTYFDENEKKYNEVTWQRTNNISIR